jgi:hypothetical protein
MNRGAGLGVLRAFLMVVGVLLLAAGAVLGVLCSVGLMLRLALPGLLLIGGALFERWRYKRLQEGYPGPNWVATDERFVDPESGRNVRVYYDSRTGERRYVAS